jgi:hypothetical protein
MSARSFNAVIGSAHDGRTPLLRAIREQAAMLDRRLAAVRSADVTEAAIPVERIAGAAPLPHA